MNVIKLSLGVEKLIIGNISNVIIKNLQLKVING